MTALEVWYSRLDLELLVEQASGRKERKQWLKVIIKAESRTSSHEFPKIAAIRNGRARIVDRPPLMLPPTRNRTFGKDRSHYFSTLPRNPSA